MVSFETEFPSLKNVGCCPSSDCSNDCRNEDHLAFSTYDIMEHCLDKARVREVIEKYFFNKEQDALKEAILKELGL